MSFFFSKTDANPLLASHPAHLVRKDDSTASPSALIPFCSFNSDIKGKVMSKFSFPVCDLFDPVVLDGKLCYQMDMAKKLPKENTVQGNGLVLIIDANKERSVSKRIERKA